jgi:hypothetical protein
LHCQRGSLTDPIEAKWQSINETQAGNQSTRPRQHAGEGKLLTQPYPPRRRDESNTGKFITVPSAQVSRHQAAQAVAQYCQRALRAALLDGAHEGGQIVLEVVTQ